MTFILLIYISLNFENKKGVPKGFELGTQLTFNNRGTF
jgi:hypothetical protein